MNADELRTLIGENEEFEEFVKSGLEEFSIDGLKFEMISHEREDSAMVCIFKVGENYFEVLGDYNSWEGTTWHDVYGFVQVKPVEVTVIQYHRI